MKSLEDSLDEETKALITSLNAIVKDFAANLGKYNSQMTCRRVGNRLDSVTFHIFRGGERDLKNILKEDFIQLLQEEIE